MKKNLNILIVILLPLMATACSKVEQTQTDLYECKSEQVVSSGLNENSGVVSSSTIISDSSDISSEVVISITSEHQGLSKVDLVLDQVGYSLKLFFEPMEWDNFDNETRVEIAKSALEYAFQATREYKIDTAGFQGFTSDGDLIIYNSSEFFIVVRSTDGSSTYNSDIWPIIS